MQKKSTLLHRYIQFTKIDTHTQVLLTYMKRFYLLDLLTFEIQTHVKYQLAFTSHIQTKRITHCRLTFIRLYIQSYKRAFHTDIRICRSTCLKTYIG